MKKMGRNILGKGVKVAVAVSPDKAVVHTASGVFKDANEVTKLVQRAVKGVDLGTIKVLSTEVLPDKSVKALIQGTKKDLREFSKFAKIVYTEVAKKAKK